MGNIRAILIALLGSVCACSASWPHWQPTAGSVISNAMVRDLWQAQTERFDVIQAQPITTPQTGTPIGGPILLTVDCEAYDGYTNAATVITNGATVWTNSVKYSVYLTHTLTNAATFEPFTNVTSYTVTETNINYPWLTRANLVRIDVDNRSVSARIGDYYALTNASGDYEAHFATAVGGVYPQSFPRAYRPAIFDAENIGLVTNVQSDPWGYITNGTALWTRQPATTQNWTLADIRLVYQRDTNGVATNTTGVLDTRLAIHFDDYHTGALTPTIKRIDSYTGTHTAVQLHLSGLVISGLGTTTATEAVTVSSTNAQALVNRWYRIDAITNSPALPDYQDGETYWIGYDGLVTLYGDRPWVMYARDLQERQRYWNALRWSYDEAGEWSCTNAAKRVAAALGVSTNSAAEAWTRLTNNFAAATVTTTTVSTTAAAFNLLEIKMEFDDSTPGGENYQYRASWHAQESQNTVRNPRLNARSTSRLSTNIAHSVTIYRRMETNNVGVSATANEGQPIVVSFDYGALSSNSYEIAATVDAGRYGVIYTGPNNSTVTEAGNTNTFEFVRRGRWAVSAKPAIQDAWKPGSLQTNLVGAVYEAINLIQFDQDPTNGLQYVYP